MDGRILKAALAYAERLGWSVLPLHSITAGRCTCDQLNCSSAGKHPLTKNGVKDATKDPVVIKQWFTRWPQANLAVCCGKASSLFVLDIDPRHGGNDSLYSLVAEYGELPATPTVKTGGNGAHIYFRYPKDTEIPNRIGLLPGVDVKSDGGFVVLPPSRHISGRRYEWQKGHNPLEVPMTEPPAWLLDLVANKQQRQAKSTEHWQKLLQGVTEGRRNQSITEYAGRLLSHGISAQETLQLMLAWNKVFCHPPLGDGEVARTVDSVAKRELEKLKGRIKNVR